MIFHPRLTLRVNEILLKIQHIRIVRQYDLHTIRGMQLDVHVGISFIPSLVGERLEKTHCCLSNGKKEKIITEYSFDCIVVRKEYLELRICIYFENCFLSASNSTKGLYTTFEIIKEKEQIA